jgi:hypothetical protein
MAGVKVMRGNTASHEEPYRELADYSWTEKAFGMLERGDLHGQIISRDKVISSRVWGPCPRCGHVLDDRQTHTAITNLMYREWRITGETSGGQPDSGGASEQYVPIDVSCGCADSHRGAPPGTTGCGVSFRVELPLQLPDSRQP